jgi:GT2 family glycosyltransferase
LRLSVVIPTFNRVSSLLPTLYSLGKQKLAEPWEVVLVDNNSTDGTMQRVRAEEFPFHIVMLKEVQPGVAAARNAGARAASGEYVLFMDDDIVAEPDFLARHLHELESHRGCWIVGQVINRPEQERTSLGRLRRSVTPLLPPSAPAYPATGVTGQNLSMPRADFMRLGGFDQTFTGASVEDLDLAIRAWDSGIEILMVPSIVCMHDDWAGWTLADYARRQRLYARNEFAFWRKHGKAHPRSAFVRANLPIRLGRDRPVEVLRKGVRCMAGGKVMQRLLVVLCACLERCRVPDRVLWPAYRLTLSGSTYRGFDEGLRQGLEGRRGR